MAYRGYAGGRWIEIDYGRPIKRSRALFTPPDFVQNLNGGRSRVARRREPVDGPDDRASPRLRRDHGPARLSTRSSSSSPTTDWILILSRWPGTEEVRPERPLRPLRRLSLSAEQGRRPDPHGPRGAAPLVRPSSPGRVPRHERCGRQDSPCSGTTAWRPSPSASASRRFGLRSAGRLAEASWPPSRSPESPPTPRRSTTVGLTR